MCVCVQVPVVADLPVGDNLQDHIHMEGMLFTITEPVSITPAKARSLRAQLQYMLTGAGSCANKWAFLASRLCCRWVRKWSNIVLDMTLGQVKLYLLVEY